MERRKKKKMIRGCSSLPLAVARDARRARADSLSPALLVLSSASTSLVSSLPFEKGTKVLLGLRTTEDVLQVIAKLGFVSLSSI